MKAAIKGVFGYLPEGVLTNQDLEKMVDTSDEWITTRTGIKNRHIIRQDDFSTSDMGAEAVKGLLKKTDTRPEDIELLICATVTPDQKLPDTANIIRDKVGIANGFGFDLNAACSGFLYALTTAAKFIESGFVKRIIVVGSDHMSTIVDYTDRKTCVIFGDGAAAVLLEADAQYGLEDAILRSDGIGREHLKLIGGGARVPLTAENINDKLQYVKQDGRTVFKHAVRGMSGTVSDVLKNNNLDISEIDWLVPHQANKRIIDTVGEYLKIPEEKVMVNIHKYGNTTAATIPLCLRDYESQLKKGDKLMLTAFGGGFTWGAIYLTWAY